MHKQHIFDTQNQKRNITNKDSYIFANSEAMKMQEGTVFAATKENWPHLLQKYQAEAAAFAKGGKKAALPAGAPAFIKLFFG